MALTDNLISYWPMNGDPGDTRFDEGGSINDFLDPGLVARGTGHIGFCVDFVSINGDYLFTLDDASLHVGAMDWTFTCWIKHGATGNAGILSRRDSADPASSTFELTTLGASQVTLRTISGGTTTVLSTPAGASIAGQWAFVAFGWDEAAKRSWVRLNDSDATAALSGVIGTPNAGILELEAGRSDRGSGASLDGSIDEVGFWKRKLTPAEITELYNGGVGFAWPFTPTASSRREAFPLTVNFTHAAAVVPADGDPGLFATPAYAEGLWVGGLGDITLRTRGGETVTLSAVPAGTFLPISCAAVDATGTTATLIVRLWRE